MRHLMLSVAALCLVIAAGGCTSTQEPINDSFGEAYYHNMAVHVIDPNPANAGSGAPELEGERARVAIDRYRATRTVKPVTVTTTGAGSSSGSGSN